MIVPRLLRTSDAAKLIGVSASYLSILRMTGKLENRMTPPPHVSVGTGRGGIRYDIRDMEKWARENTTGQALSAFSSWIRRDGGCRNFWPVSPRFFSMLNRF